MPEGKCPYLAIAYEPENGTIVHDQAEYDNEKEAIRFARSHGWDEVIDTRTQAVVWRR